MSPRSWSTCMPLLRIAIFLAVWWGAASWAIADGTSKRPMSKSYRDIDYSMTPEEARNVRVMETVTSLWFLAIGCCVGSFLNVVVYREPRGLAVGLPRSRCPKCQNAISPRDNIPIIGWLRLRGRCRTCQLPISPRYPLIEAAIGLLFVALLHRELLSGGGNLPVRDINTYKGVVWVLWYTKWDLLGIYLFHLMLLVVLWGAALIEHDGFAWPKRLFRFALGLGLVMLAIWPHLLVIPAWLPQPDWIKGSRLSSSWRMGYGDPIGVGWSGPFTGLIGAAASGGIMWMLTSLDRRTIAIVAGLDEQNAIPPRGVDHRLQLTLSAALTGLFLGWQTGFTLAVIGVVLLAVIGRFESGVRRHSVTLFAGLTTVAIFLWRPAVMSVTTYFPVLNR